MRNTSSSDMASLSGQVRLRRALTLYYIPCVGDNFNSVDGELNIAEPILRTTAAAVSSALWLTSLRTALKKAISPLPSCSGRQSIGSP